jgi:hypothetical protein
MNNLEVFNNPAQCLNEIVQAWTEYQKIVELEKTKRRDIEAWEKVTLAEIKAKRYFLMEYLDRSFDERSKAFKKYFQVIDSALSSGDNQQLALALHAVTELAKTSPFKNLSDLSSVKAALNDPDHVWEL